MAKLEIPSIIVEGRATKTMERTVRTQRTLSKQDSIDDDADVGNYDKRRNSPDQGNCKSQAQGQSPTENTSHQHGQPTSQNLHRSRSQNKVKLLVRSHAVREETSPPPDPPQDHTTKQDTRKKDWQPSLSRGNSREQQYDGSNPVDLHQFIVDTLNRNYKDRLLLLKIENELINLVNDPSRPSHKFPQMSSYQRMLVHRVAAYYNMEHNVDTSGVAVIVNTCKLTRIPDSRFRDFVRDDLLLPEEPRRSILKRDSSSFDETGSYKCGERMLGGDSRRSKSFEEREEEYEKARRRIFNRDHSVDGEIDCMDDLQWENEEACAFPNDCEQNVHSQRNGRLLKVESYESGDTLRANSLRLSVSKSHSFNGYEAQQPPPHHPPPNRVLTKQDSGSSMSSRISPSSSSGYKSQRSDATLSATPSPSATPNLHTQSGQPYTNPDGTVYHYDPNNPPRVVAENTIAPSPIAPPQGTPSPAKLEGCEMVQNKIENSYEAQFLPQPAQQYPQVMEPQQIQYQPVYPPPLPPQHYQHPRLQDNMGNGDLSQYMVGLSIDGPRQQVPHQMPSDTRHVYWSPHHVQGQAQGGTVYYAAPGQRYPQLAPPQPYMPQPPQQQHPPSEHPPATYLHNGYVSGYPTAEHMSYAPSAVPMYYTQTPYNSIQNNTNQSNLAHPGANNYYGNMPSCGAPIFAVQYPQCSHPTSPHAPQAVCGQFAVYNGCYPVHYNQPPSSFPVPAQLFRKPALQVGMRCSSPLRNQYPASPTVKDRSHEEKFQPLPLYGIRVVPGDMRLLGNPGRLPFTLQPPSKPAHARKHRSKMGGRPQESYHAASKA